LTIDVSPDFGKENIPLVSFDPFLHEAKRRWRWCQGLSGVWKANSNWPPCYSTWTEDENEKEKSRPAPEPRPGSVWVSSVF